MVASDVMIWAKRLGFYLFIKPWDQWELVYIWIFKNCFEYHLPTVEQDGSKIIKTAHKYLVSLINFYMNSDQFCYIAALKYK